MNPLKREGQLHSPNSVCEGDPHFHNAPKTLTNKKLLLDYQLPSRLDAITSLAAAVDAALITRPDLAFSANLCLEELISNIIQYGLQGIPDRIITVLMSLSDEWLEICLRDDAPEFDPFVKVAEPDLNLTIDERPIGGLGVHLVKKIMDKTYAFYDGSGNLIVLLKTVRDNNMVEVVSHTQCDK